MPTTTPRNETAARSDDALRRTLVTDVGLRHTDVRLDLRAEHARRLRIERRTCAVTVVALGMIILGMVLRLVSYFESGGEADFFARMGAICIILAVVATAPALYLTLLMYRNRHPLRWHCPNCDKSLSVWLNWTCGHCDFRNGKRSFLDMCERCRTVPASYECQHCRTLTHFTPERNGRLPARHRVIDAVEARSIDDLRDERARSIEEHDHQIEELTRKIKIRDLVDRLSPPGPPDEKQARVDATVREIDRIVDECRTVADSVVAQNRFNAEIDNRHDLDRQVRDDLKALAAARFSDFRGRRGGEISMDAQKRPSW